MAQDAVEPADTAARARVRLDLRDEEAVALAAAVDTLLDGLASIDEDAPRRVEPALRSVPGPQVAP